MKSPALPTAPGTCFRFVVASAEEAATLIRERLGPDARVLSVRSLPAPGVQRLWSAPRLEVVAQIGAGPSEASAGTQDPASAPPGRKAPRERSLRDLLRRSGLSEVALGRLQSAPFWEESASWPLHRALAEAGEHLRRDAERRWRRTPLNRAAFLGGPGVGRTTALCKWLGTEVFRRSRLGHVVTVEFDRPNPTGPLPVFGEALGVPVARYPAATEAAVPGGFVYFDLPSFSVDEPSENTALAGFLERERIAQRVLVLNAAYDHAALRAAYSAGRSLGATHLVFTHLDEVPQWGRLWDYLLDGALEPLFLATGPSLTGDCKEEVYRELVGRTLAGASAGPGAPDEIEEGMAASDRP
jgi:flagellar biosynthesis protein FlhF